MARLRNRIFGALAMLIGLGVLLYGLIPLLRWAIFDLLITFLGLSGIIQLIIWIVILVVGALLLILGLVLFIRE